MASTTQQIDTRRASREEKVLDFSPGDLKAPFLLRCAAFCIDYMVLLALPISWLIATRFLSEHGTASVSEFIWFLGVLLLAINFLLFPLLRGQTIGKMITGITIVNMDGTHLEFKGLMRRNVLGYLATAATFGLGFVLAGINSNGRALHDLIGGTMVVRARRTTV
ncbi:MAG: RDD family protein [Pyrinomonadaceae bacterium]